MKGYTSKQLLTRAANLARGWIKCWACDSVISPQSRLNTDGNCPKCGNEICLDEEDDDGEE